MNKPYAKSKKPVTKDHVLYDSIYMKRLEEATLHRQAVGNDTRKGLRKQHQPELKPSGPRGGGANTGFRIAPAHLPLSWQWAPTPTKPWPWHRMALGGRSRSYLLAGPRKHRKIRGLGGTRRCGCSQRVGGRELAPRHKAGEAGWACGRAGSGGGRPCPEQGTWRGHRL